MGSSRTFCETWSRSAGFLTQADTRALSFLEDDDPLILIWLNTELNATFIHVISENN